MDYQDGTGQHIWLRYATEYKKDGRTHTIEVGVPMPLGASAETREKLLREAEMGMSQLVQHVEERVFQALERVQSADTQGATVPIPLILPSSPAPKGVSPALSSSAASTSSKTQATPSTPDQPPPVQVRPANKSASVPAPQTSPTQVPNAPRILPRTAPPAAQAVAVPPTRDSVGASMPSSLGPNTAGGNLTIPDFISYITKNLNLTPKQAMELLRVKTLTGINLREALEKLKQIVAQNAQSEPGTPQQQASKVREASPVVSTPVSYNTPSSLPAQSTAPMLTIDELPTRPADEASEGSQEERTSNVIEMRVPRPAQPTRGFDEEDDLEDLDDADNVSLAPEISPERLRHAQDKINSLREMQGATVASSERLRALRNAADDEVSTEQLQELAAGVWHIQSLRKLKMDQVEALISWAKQDDFLHEVEAVLVVLQEEY